MKGTSTALLLAVVLLPGRAARAQQGPVSLEFSFSNPGARSLGFGGAFTALADDATAAFANPAGLVQLSEPEVSAEGRFWSFATPFTEGGRISGQPTGVGLDTTAGLRTATSTADLSSISFLSFVYPRGKWALALYRHQLANYRASSRSQGFFADVPGLGDAVRLEDNRVDYDLQLVSYAVAAAYRPTESLSFGIGLAYVEGTLANASETYVPFESTLPAGPFGPNAFRPEARLSSLVADADDSDWTLNAGVLWRVTRSWSVGGFYRQGPSFDVTIQATTGPAAEPVLPEGTVIGQVSGPLELPPVFGLGLAFRSESGAFSAAFEWDRVQYSVILESLRRLETGIEEVVDDADELRLGFEYLFLRTRPLVAIRLGTWLDPDHRFAATGDNLLEHATFRPGEDQLHLALGLGLGFERGQIDVGVDLSHHVKTAAASLILRF